MLSDRYFAIFSEIWVAESNGNVSLTAGTEIAVYAHAQWKYGQNASKCQMIAKISVPYPKSWSSNLTAVSQFWSEAQIGVCGFVLMRSTNSAKTSQNDWRLKLKCIATTTFSSYRMLPRNTLLIKKIAEGRHFVSADWHPCPWNIMLA